MNVLALILALEQKGMEAADILDVVKAMAHAQPVAPPHYAPVVDAAAQRRRAADRERKREARLRNSAEMSAESADAAPDKESLPRTPSKEINPSPSLSSDVVLARECERELLDAGVSPETLNAWKGVRRAKKAGPITRPVVDRIVREAGRAGISISQAVTICVERGWQSLDADWIAKPMARAGPSQAPPRRGGNSAMIDEIRRMREESENVYRPDDFGQSGSPLLRISSG